MILNSKIPHPFFKVQPFNFVPLSRTPWGGTRIAEVKKKYHPTQDIPALIGESWEFSTDASFPSYVQQNENTQSPLLTDYIEAHGPAILGESLYTTYGAHVPLLLKWLCAKDLLSVQLHPTNTDPRLKPGECGKPEAWLVLDAQQDSYVYLGFKEGLTPTEITQALLEDDPERCLYKYHPQKYDVIFVPPGLVHAIGPGVFVIEPQYVLPQKSGKTWRISDWKRTYLPNGTLSPQGTPRELHTADALGAIDWNLPQGKALVNQVVTQVSHAQAPQLPGNPFLMMPYLEAGTFIYNHLIPEQFSLISVWSGKVTLRDMTGDTPPITLLAGECGCVCAFVPQVEVILESYLGETPGACFFGFLD